MTTEGAVIRYTTDGGEPTESSDVYTGPVTVETSVTIKAKVFKEGWTDGETLTAVYTINTFTEDLFFNWFVWNAQNNQRYFTIEATASDGGTISPAGRSEVLMKSHIVYTITPDKGFAISDVLVDGVSVGVVDSYQLRNVTESHSIHAVFEKTVKTAWVNPFGDVSENDGYHDAMKFVNQKGLFFGVSDSEFGPEITMTRAMFVTVPGRLAGIDTAMYEDVSFNDVQAGQWYTPYVEWAVQKGIVSGYDADTFGPDDIITTEQAVTILYRYAQLTDEDIGDSLSLVRYADAKSVSDWAKNAMEWAVGNKIYTGAGDKLSAKTEASRGLVAQMLYNYVTAIAK
ncbi:MAG: S-layer homology domain-containing protein [Eubacteriales bacterium]|nr:S-layer homology domain-containing protein [Eubacteriales bacterium]